MDNSREDSWVQEFQLRLLMILKAVNANVEVTVEALRSMVARVHERHHTCQSVVAINVQALMFLSSRHIRFADQGSPSAGTEVIPEKMWRSPA